jgi:hypothetical protein
MGFMPIFALYSGEPNPNACLDGTQDLQARGYETDPLWIWYDQVGLACLTTIFLSLTYINLRTVKKLK